MPKRIRFVRFEGKPLPAGAKVITRPTRWGNPFRVRIKDDKVAHAECVAQYREWIMAPEQSELRRAIKRELACKDLACSCKLGLPCHGDVLLEIANEN